MKSTTWHRIITAITMVIILQVACGQQYTRVSLDGYSMEPNFTDGDIFRIVEVSLTELKRGDLVLVEIDGKLLIKRLIGLPNETVSISDGIILIDGIPLIEPYEVKPPTYTVDEVKLDKDSYYVLGDNRPNSFDSHSQGAVQGIDIKGKAIPDK